MSDIVAEVASRVAGDGWSVIEIVDPALVVEGRDLGVAIVHARKPPLRAWVVVLRGGEDGDTADRYAFLDERSPAVAARRLARGKVRAKVVDAERAREELARLRPVLASSCTLQSAVAALEEAGWQIDEREETVLDEPSWRIRASRPGERLEIDAGLRPGGSPALGVDDAGTAHLVGEHVSAFASVASVDRARGLVDLLATLG